MRRPRKHFTVRKWMGDDLYSWAVFHRNGGAPVVCGCSKSEANHHANQLEKMKEEAQRAVNGPKVCP